MFLTLTAKSKLRRRGSKFRSPMIQSRSVITLVMRDSGIAII
jgi:hypothetical protein